jgi:SSS family solute:Na+ symporter
MTRIHLQAIDYLLIAIYFVFVLGIGFALRRHMRTGGDFLLSGRSLPAWVCGLAFLSANLGAQEVIGMGACGAKYGMLTCHFYWIPAVGAMVFVGLFMMPFYYGSRARSVPEYLRLRFDDKTRVLNAATFAAMTVLSSGISMFAMAKLLEILLGLDFNVSILASAAVVLSYILLGGLTSAIYNEVLQFFLIFFGFLPLALLGLRDTGGWTALQTRLAILATGQGYAPDTYTSVWHPLREASANPMGVEWIGMAMGLGWVLGFGYWCTDFLVVQRAMAADSMNAARRTPLIAAVPKMLFPFILIVPGMIAMVLHAGSGGGLMPILADGSIDYNMAIPSLMGKYLTPGLMGLGLTALMASFMSGMAGNVTAFNTVWTYDLYQGYIRPGRPDSHYLRMGHMATVGGILLSVGAAYSATKFNNIMDLLQLVFAFVNAPLFATFLLGMFWKRATGHGAFYGLLSGTLAAAVHHGLTVPLGASTLMKGGWVLAAAKSLGIASPDAAALHIYRSEMAQNFWTAIWAWCVCFSATLLISLLTARNRSDEDLRGLVYSLTERVTTEGVPWFKRPALFGSLVLAAVIALNIIFW